MSEMYIQNMIPGYFPIFTDVFSQWFSLIERYNQQMPDDVPWWYNERASLSFFAGAVWNSGGIALEEYSTGKSHKKESWLGRGDLYIKIKEEEYVIEVSSGLGSDQINCLIEQIISIKKGLIPGLERQF